ncbi:hypothetical protein HYT54_04145 [Candidatus Woesearchaeota archaeon]|nr:hypothetical protein [Candidatus Woesearchaeota archaeon]
MGTVSHIPEFRIKYSDVFSLRNLYIMMHELLLEEGWRGFDGDGDHADIETLYSENVYQKGIHRGGKEMWIWWRARKYWEGKYSGYFRNQLEIDMHIVYSQDAEAVHQGKKIRVQKGEIEMFFRPKIESDYGAEKWEKHWLLKHVKSIYEHRIIHKEIDKREKELWRDAYKIHAKIKDYLNLRTFMTVAPPFFPKKYGWEG